MQCAKIVTSKLKLRSFIKSSCNDLVSIGCDDLTSSVKCTQDHLQKVSTDLCNEFNTKVDKCNSVKKKEINMQYDKCIDEVKRDFIIAKCDTIKSKYVPLGLVWFSHVSIFIALLLITHHIGNLIQITI